MENLTLDQLEESIQESTDSLELLKTDLRWQLSFEEIDWDYFIEFAERAKVARNEIEEMKLRATRQEFGK